LSNFEKIIKDNINNSEIRWFTDPFPHVVIDDFLPSELFLKISKKLNKIRDIKDLKKTFKSHVELNKKVYGDKDFDEDLKLPIEAMGSDAIKEIFQKYLNIKKMISLNDWSNYGGYFPLHSMEPGGLLGAHIDHSHSKTEDLLHMGNSIFYASSKWKESWGGETILFSNNGFKIIKKITPKPNRLILFVHTESSFHGVNKINCPNDTSRNTYYMDYYINDDQMLAMLESLKTKINKNLKFTFHSTTFIPFFPLGYKSFKINSILEPSTFRYIIKYIRYLIARFLLGYKLSMFIKKFFK
jgi:hypothetical protein